MPITKVVPYFLPVCVAAPQAHRRKFVSATQIHHMAYQDVKGYSVVEAWIFVANFVNKSDQFVNINAATWALMEIGEVQPWF